MKNKENTGFAKDAGPTSSDTTESEIEIITPPPPPPSEKHHLQPPFLSHHQHCRCLPLLSCHPPRNKVIMQQMRSMQKIVTLTEEIKKHEEYSEQYK